MKTRYKLQTEYKKTKTDFWNLKVEIRNLLIEEISKNFKKIVENKYFTYDRRSGLNLRVNALTRYDFRENLEELEWIGKTAKDQTIIDRHIELKEKYENLESSISKLNREIKNMDALEELTLLEKYSKRLIENKIELDLNDFVTLLNIRLTDGDWVGYNNNTYINTIFGEHTDIIKKILIDAGIISYEYKENELKKLLPETHPAAKKGEDRYFEGSYRYEDNGWETAYKIYKVEKQIDLNMTISVNEYMAQDEYYIKNYFMKNKLTKEVILNFKNSEMVERAIGRWENYYRKSYITINGLTFKDTTKYEKSIRYRSEHGTTQLVRRDKFLELIKN